MGTGYTRNDTSNNIANGKVIDATDLDGEFDAIVTAFSTSGHTHDGTSAEGGAVTKLLGTSLTLGDGTAGTDITVTFDGETSDGVLKWMEDEDYFQFNDDILINTNEKLYFRDTGIYISSNADGDLDIVSDGTAVDSINIESAGGITLDAGTAASGVIFEDDGTEMLRIYNSSSDVHIESKVSNKDILIRGNDNGSDITAVTFDMSEAGLATFGGGITSTAVANTLGATSFSDANITNVGNIALDSITADGSTITITGNTTFADGSFNFNIASHDGSNGLQLGGVLVTATAAELNIMDGVTATTSELNIMDGVTATTAEINIMDGVTATATELNIMDGDTSASSTTVVDADRVVLNDDGTMKQVAVTDLAAYFDDEITAMPNLVTTAATTVGALNSGSITSGFGSIDIGSSTITTTGLISGGSLDIDDVLINGTTIGHTDDTDLITLADGVVTVAGELDATTLDISGNADIDGTLEADAITVDGTALDEFIQDTVGAMFTNNTETNITVTYQDSDGTIDLVAQASADLVSDTSPQLGGTLDINSQKITSIASGSTQVTDIRLHLDSTNPNNNVRIDSGNQPTLEFYRPTSSVTAYVAEIDFRGNDPSSGERVYGSIEGQIWNSNTGAVVIEAYSGSTLDVIQDGVAIKKGLFVGDDRYSASIADNEIRATGSITQNYSSDINLKENIKELTNCLDKVCSLRAIEFDWKDDHIESRGGADGYFVTKHDVGVVAQEVQPVLPESVKTREDGHLAIEYHKLIPLLIGAIKDQQKQIDILKGKING